MVKIKYAAVLIVLVLAFLLRFYGAGWDGWNHLHPDERMLIMVADRVTLFKNMNPDFFNYGSLPVYLLKGTAQLSDYLFKTEYTGYDGLLKLGRIFSALFDTVTVFFIYQIGVLLFTKRKTALFGAVLYSVAFFPIQNSHFFVVDVLLTMLTTVLFYLLLKYGMSDRTFHINENNRIIFISAVFAAMITTKFTAIIFLPLIVFVIVFVNFRHWIKMLVQFFLFGVTSLLLSYAFMPYAFIEYGRFVDDISAQLKMGSDPYIFPYTLQYVGSLPYLYFLKNIFFWGLGPVISFLVIIGLYKTFKIIQSNFCLPAGKKMTKYTGLLFLLIFYLFYFLVVGRSAVKFMRYMLPLYPALTLLAGYGLSLIYEKSRLLSQILTVFILIWSFMFLGIYSTEHTRLSASRWILKNIPAGSSIAVEHWDDRLPVSQGEKYNFQELTLYDQPDNDAKWLVLDQKLKNSDYIIIASNRLYVPIGRLTDCKKYKICFPLSSNYYSKLFAGKLPFIKVAEFTDYPGFKAGKWDFRLVDDGADESFTVYDHPKIMIFKKVTSPF